MLRAGHSSCQDKSQDSRPSLVTGVSIRAMAGLKLADSEARSVPQAVSVFFGTEWFVLQRGAEYVSSLRPTIKRAPECSEKTI